MAAFVDNQINDSLPFANVILEVVSVDIITGCKGKCVLFNIPTHKSIPQIFDVGHQKIVTEYLCMVSHSEVSSILKHYNCEGYKVTVAYTACVTRTIDVNDNSMINKFFISIN